MSDKITIPSRVYREGEIETRADTGASEDDRRLWLSFSSETPVLRDFGDGLRGYEILGHGEGEVDLAFMQSGRAPLLTDHVQNIDSQVGVVEKVEIAEGKGRALVRFGKGARATEVLARVRDGEIQNVSVGYEILRLVQVGERDGDPVLRAHWRPKEITLCPVPADSTVGVGRSAGGDEIRSIELERKASDMPNETTTLAATQDSAPASTETRAATVPAAPKGPDLNSERARVRDIRTLARAHKMPDDAVDTAIDNGHDVATFQRAILDHLGSSEQETTRNRASTVGLSGAEVRRYSIMNAVRFLSNPTDKRAAAAAAFEIEVSQAAEETLKRSAKGLIVPPDILNVQDFTGKRSMAVGDANKGAALVATEHLDGSFIGLLRKRAALTQLGIRTITGLTGNVSIPRQTGASTAYWVGEGSGPTESDFTLDGVTMTPHTLAGAVSITRQMMIQSSPDIEALVRDDLIKVLALELDRVGINGDADADAPNGLLDHTINDADFGTAGQPTWAEVVAMETKVAENDADADNMAYLFPASVVGHLKSTPKVAGTAAFIWENGNVNGYRAVRSNNAPAAGGLFGNWSDMILGMWSGLDLTVDTATLASSGGVYLRAFQDVDYAVRHGASFTYGRDYV